MANVTKAERPAGKRAAVKKNQVTGSEIDLDIIEGGAGKPTMPEILYAGRIAAGDAPMPEDGDPAFTPGVRQALAVRGRTVVTAPNPGTEARLVAVAAQFGVTTDDLGELARIGADSINRAMFEISRAGLAFLRAQSLISLGNGGDRGGSFRNSETENSGFVAWITDNGLAQQRVYEAMRIAKFVTQLPAEQLDDVLALGKVKVMLLASLPQEVIDQAAESGNDLIGKADLMTVAELKEEIASLKRREKNYEAEIERAQHQVERLSKAKKRTTEFLLRTEEIREECMALQLGAELNMDSLKKLFEEVNGEEQFPPEGKIQLEQIWITAHVVAARAMDMVERMKDTVTMVMPERFTGAHILTPAEAERWLLDYPMIANHHAAEKAARQEKRDAAQPRGPGRPKGSGKKAEG